MEYKQNLKGLTKDQWQMNVHSFIQTGFARWSEINKTYLVVLLRSKDNPIVAPTL